MSITDIFKIKQFKQEIAAQSARIAELEALLTPELREVEAVQKRLAELNGEIDAKKKSLEDMISDAEVKRKCLADTAERLESEIRHKENQVIILEDQILVQSFGLYEPVYDFVYAEGYKAELERVRERQKEMIRAKTAATGATEWQVNGSAAQGRKMVSDMQKLLLRAFNSECDSIVAKVKYNNFDTMLKRINTACDAVSKLGTIMHISISEEYRSLKIQELRLALEYQLKKHEESERLKELRAQQREEAKLQKEIEAQRDKIRKEEQHFTKALVDLEKQIAASGDTVDQALLDRRAELQEKLGDVQRDLETIDYREANQKAGYVYIISNIGAFGENVYKIGMTRRLDPAERIYELSDASVPFNFDIHAMIFTDDAPALETALHKAFEDRKLNLVNPRREFFRVTLDEIKEVVRNNFDETVEFFDVPDADQYRISEKMRAR